MFKLKNIIARNVSTDLDDTSIIKSAMTALGYYDDSRTGLSPYGDNQMFHAIKAFQKDNNLDVDGEIYPDGPTQRTIKENLQAIPQALGAYKSMVKNYLDMREADTINADKYFHCKANYEAARRGWRGYAVAEDVSNMKELLWAPKEVIKNGFDATLKDIAEDQKANNYGREAGLSGRYSSAREACAIYRPKGLNEKY